MGDSSAIVGFKGIVTFVLQFVLSAESVKRQEELVKAERIIRHFKLNFALFEIMEDEIRILLNNLRLMDVDLELIQKQVRV